MLSLSQQKKTRMSSPPAARYDLIALPVVNISNQMVGIITVDDILDVIEDEATEDIQMLGGSRPLDSLTCTPDFIPSSRNGSSGYYCFLLHRL